MRGRQRHLNARDAGASMVLDSRFITGLADDDVVTTWPDRSRNGYSPTQSTADKKPKFKTGVSGGQPTVRFDGADDSLYYNANVAPNAGVSVFLAVKLDSLTDRNPLVDIKNSGSSFDHFVPEANTYSTAGQLWGFYSCNGSRETDAPTSANPTLLAIVADTTNGGVVIDNTNYFVNGISKSLTNKAASTIYNDITELNGVMIGSYNVGGTASYLCHNGDTYNITVIPTQVSAALRRRLEHAAAYSFKIPCS